MRSLIRYVQAVLRELEPPPRSAGGWSVLICCEKKYCWSVLICCEKKILLADWWSVVSAEMM
jgi:hypothetical protein